MEAPSDVRWSVVIPTRLRAPALARLLDALGEVTTSAFEVVVVIDGPDAATRALATQLAPSFPVRWQEHAHNLGISAARNTGARHARGEWLLFLDDDVLPVPHILAEHDQMHAQAEAARHVVFGCIEEGPRVQAGSHTERLMQASWERTLARLHPAGRGANTLSVGPRAEADVAFGLNCSLRRDAFLAEGGFDEQLRSDEECEMGLRLYRRGYLFSYAPRARIVHASDKPVAPYFAQCWAQSGANDLHRARVLAQKSRQNAQLGAFRRDAWPMARWRGELVWRAAGPLAAAASVAQRLTDATGSRLAFALWARSRRLSAYWGAVKRTGVTRRELRELAGAPQRMVMLHSLSVPHTPEEADFYLRPERFRRFISLLDALGFVIAHPDDLLAGRAPPRSLALTFDDAYDDLHDELLPLIHARRIAPLVFVVAGEIGGTNRWDQSSGLRPRALMDLGRLKEMQAAGAVIGSHSMTHPMLPTLGYARILAEVRDSRSRLQDLLGCAVDWFAYPYGEVDRRVRAAVAEAGYKAAVTTAPGVNFWNDPLALERITINDGDGLLDMLGKLATGKDVAQGVRNVMGRQRARWRAARAP